MYDRITNINYLTQGNSQGDCIFTQTPHRRKLIKHFVDYLSLKMVAQSFELTKK